MIERLRKKISKKEDTKSDKTPLEKEKKTIGTIWNENMQDESGNSKGMFKEIFQGFTWNEKNIKSLVNNNVN